MDFGRFARRSGCAESGHSLTESVVETGTTASMCPTASSGGSFPGMVRGQVATKAEACLRGDGDTSRCLVFPPHASSMRRYVWKEEEGQTEDEVNGKKLHALEPIGSSVASHLSGDQHGQKYAEDEASREGQIHWRGTKE